jgi:uncharacterized protein (DUF58 family)
VIPKEILKALRKIELTSTRLANEQQLAGNYRSAILGQGLAFQEVRPYQPGDDVRNIDWNVSARMNEAFIKVFSEEREMTVMLIVDVSESSLFGSTKINKRWLATEVAAVFALSAVSHNDRVGLIATSDVVERIVPPQKGKKHGMVVLREIFELVPQRRGTNLAVGLETLMHLAKRRTVTFVLSDFLTHGYERALALASARHDVIPIVLTDPRDRDIPNVGLAEFEDLETGELVTVDTQSAKVRAALAASVDRERARQVQLFRKLGLDSVFVSTAEPYFRPLRELFRRRAKKVFR